jgi:hypothetical protein
MVRNMIGDQPGREASGQAAMRPDPFLKVFGHGSEEAASKQR